MTNRVTASPSEKATATPVRSNRFLPRIGSPGYHLLLTAVAILILGPLGGISAAFMNFSIGFFIGGEGLAGLFGSVVALPDGPGGKDGGSYLRTLAGLCGRMLGAGVMVDAV